MKRLGYVVAVVALSVPVLAQTNTPAAAGSSGRVLTTDLLNMSIPEVSFGDTAPLDGVIEWLANYTGITFNVRWERLDELGIERDKPISVRGKNLKLSQVLWMVMNEAGGADVKLAYRASGNLLVLSTADDLGKEMLTRVYDVSDLLVRIPYFRNSPQIDLAQQTGGGAGGGTGQVFSNSGGSGSQDDEDQSRTGTGQSGEEDPEMTRLIELIRQTIEPDSWQEVGGKGTIHSFRKQIVVRNNILVHQRLGGAISED